MSKKKNINTRDRNVIALWTTNLFKKIIPNKKKKTKRLTKKEMLKLNDND